MVNFSDFSKKMAGKLDVSGLVKNVKTMVNPGHAADVAAATPMTGDALSQKVAEITASIQALTAAHAKQAEQITELNKALEQLKVQAASAAAPVIAQPTATSDTGATPPAVDAADKPAPDTTNKPDASQNPPEEGK